jgi:uncharacterized membrane protein YfcA
MTALHLLFFLLAFGAEVLGTVGGFGSSVYFVPIASFFFDFQTVLGITALYHLGSNLSKLALFRQGLNRSLLLWMGVPSMVLVVVGGLASKWVSGLWLEVMLGLFLVLLSAIFLIWKNFAFATTPRNAVVGGAVSGFAAGLLGTGGAVRGLAMAAYNLEKSAFVATSAAIDFGIDLTRTVVYFYNGFITAESMVFIPALLVIAWVGTWLGRRILRRLPQARFKEFSLVLILTIGLVVMGKSLVSQF